MYTGGMTRRLRLGEWITGIVLFAGVATVLLAFSHASTPTASLEAETGSLTGGVTTLQDSSASAGNAIKFGTGPVGIGGSWQLKFSDEFNSVSLDTSKWQMCNPSFSAQGDLNYCKTTYNDEQQWFRATTNNANVQENNGSLHLIATKENGQIYSGMVSTGPNVFGYTNLTNYKPYDFTYGYLEVRAKLPYNGAGKSNGYWPSVWMLPTNQNQAAPNNGWPNSGEEDIFEVPGNDPTELHMTEHDANTAGAGDYTVVHTADLSAAYHVYGFDWEPGYLKWYLDGTLMKTFTTPIGIKNFPFYPIINFSVGGADSWGGSGGPLHGGINATTMFPASFDVDYLRVYSH
jgi:beta-glucanase (GH16 family)